MAKKRSAMTTIVILLIILVILLSVKLFITMQSLKSCQISISSSQKQMVNVNKNNQPKVEKKVVKNTEQTKTVVKSGDLVTVDYVGKFEDGKVFDTSIETVAKESGVYQTGRDYSKGLTFKAGAGQVVPGFDKAVLGMKKGETKTVVIPPEEAYGNYDTGLIKFVPFDQLPPKGTGETYKVGDKLMTRYGRPAIIVEVLGSGVRVDFNSPFAGKTLVFTITVKDIK